LSIAQFIITIALIYVRTSSEQCEGQYKKKIPTHYGCLIVLGLNNEHNGQFMDSHKSKTMKSHEKNQESWNNILIRAIVRLSSGAMLPFGHRKHCFFSL